MRTRWFIFSILLIGSALLVSGASNDCTFLKNPDEFTVSAERRHKMRSDITSQFQMHLSAASNGAASTVDASTMPRKNFIDDSIFGRMASAGIQSAPLTSDAEFLRRVTLDLTGRIPSGEEVQAFLGDTNPSKRDLKVDALIGSPEFVDKWTMFSVICLGSTRNHRPSTGTFPDGMPFTSTSRIRLRATSLTTKSLAI